MRCESCGYTFHGKTCPRCGSSIPWDTPDGTPFPRWEKDSSKMIEKSADIDENFASPDSFSQLEFKETTFPKAKSTYSRKQKSYSPAVRDPNKKQTHLLGKLVVIIVALIFISSFLPSIVQLAENIWYEFEYEYLPEPDNGTAEAVAPAVPFNPSPQRESNPADGYGYVTPYYYTGEEYAQILAKLESPDVEVGTADYTLSAGNYIVGVDIAPGIYTGEVTGQNGSITSNNYLMTEFGIDASYYDIEGEEPSPTSFDSLYFPAGTILQISGPVQITLHSDNAQLSTMQPDEQNTAQEVVLEVGQYTAGQEIEPGKYDVILISSSGNVYRESDTSFELGINEIMGTEEYTDDIYSVNEFQNLRLNEQDTLVIDSWDPNMQIQLIPSE
ncbi:MAG: hypothetical protein ACOX60_01380 [Massiliimalia sp.]